MEADIISNCIFARGFNMKRSERDNLSNGKMGPVIDGFKAEETGASN